MKSLLIFPVFVCWGLWFGGTIAVFVFGFDFRKVLSDATFHEAVHAMFQVFGNYELILAAASLLFSGLLVVSYPTKWTVILVGCLILAGGMTVTVALGLMPGMEVLRNEGRTGSPEFIKLHVKSMIALAMQAGVLLGSGGVIMKMVAEKLEMREPKREEMPV